jgi:hypothetical protein
MNSLRLVVAAVLAAAAVAWCVTYFVSAAPQQRIEADQRSPPTLPSAKGRPDPGVSTNIQPPSTEDDIAAYKRAADAILKRAQNAKASTDEPPLVTGRIPLPKRRPLPRP